MWPRAEILRSQKKNGTASGRHTNFCSQIGFSLRVRVRGRHSALHHRHERLCGRERRYCVRKRKMGRRLEGIPISALRSDFPYGYASADATPLYIIAMNDYVAESGDIAFAKEKWDGVWKAYQFLLSDRIFLTGTRPRTPLRSTSSP